MSRATGALLSCVSFLLSSAAFACPCGDGANTGGPLTSQSELWAVQVGQTLTVAHGAWNAQGRYSGLATDQGFLQLVLAGAYRPVQDLELGLELTAVESWLRVERLEEEDAGLGDTRARLWWDAVDEPMPYLREPWPALAAFVWVRAPTGSTTASGSNGASLGTTSGGLGAWEAALGVRLLRGLDPAFRLSLSGELAYRFPDRQLGQRRELGPRALGQLGAEYLPSVEFAMALVTSLAWEGEVAIDGDRRDGTAQRLFTVGSSATWSPRDLRLSFHADVAPPVDSLSVNSVGSMSVGWALGYVH